MGSPAVEPYRGVSERSAGSCLLSRSAGRGLLNGELATGGLQGFAGGVRVDEFKAVAKKGASLADRGSDCHWAGGKRDVQLHDFPHGNVLTQHGADSDLADVHAAAFKQTARLGTDADIDGKFEAWSAAHFANVGNEAGRGLISRVQSSAFSGEGLSVADLGSLYRRIGRDAARL